MHSAKSIVDAHLVRIQVAVERNAEVDVIFFYKRLICGLRCGPFRVAVRVAHGALLRVELHNHDVPAVVFEPALGIVRLFVQMREQLAVPSHRV